MQERVKHQEIMRKVIGKSLEYGTIPPPLTVAPHAGTYLYKQPYTYSHPLHAQLTTSLPPACVFKSLE